MIYRLANWLKWQRNSDGTKAGRHACIDCAVSRCSLVAAQGWVEQDLTRPNDCMYYWSLVHACTKQDWPGQDHLSAIRQAANDLSG
jgi:hypothetical protein